MVLFLYVHVRVHEHVMMLWRDKNDVILSHSSPSAL